MNLSGIEQGELIVADIMFAEQDSKKRRFALVVSSTSYNKHSSDIVVLKVTSKTNFSGYSVELSNDFTEKKALRKESVVRADFPVTISRQNIYARPDMVKPEKLLEVKLKLGKLFGL